MNFPVQNNQQHHLSLNLIEIWIIFKWLMAWNEGRCHWNKKYICFFEMEIFKAVRNPFNPIEHETVRQFPLCYVLTCYQLTQCQFLTMQNCRVGSLLAPFFDRDVKLMRYWRNSTWRHKNHVSQKGIGKTHFICCESVHNTSHQLLWNVFKWTRKLKMKRWNCDVQSYFAKLHDAMFDEI